jgi:hypothetical protein
MLFNQHDLPPPLFSTASQGRIAMKMTLSAIKADVGSIGGHIAPATMPCCR